MTFWILGAAGICVFHKSFKFSEKQEHQADASGFPASQSVDPEYGESQHQPKDQEEDVFIAAMGVVIAALVWIAGILVVTLALNWIWGVVVAIASPWLFPALYRFATRNSR